MQPSCARTKKCVQVLRAQIGKSIKYKNSLYDTVEAVFGDLVCAHLGQCAMLYMSNYQSFAIAKFRLGNLAGNNYRFDCLSNILRNIEMVKSYE